jgi:Flp pilus assembly protein TadG
MQRSCQGRRGLLNAAARFSERKDGAVAVVFALAMPLMIAGAAYGVETTYWHYEKLRLQEMTDVASFAGAVERRGGSDEAAIIAAAKAAASQNGKAATDVVNVHATPQTGAFAGGDAVEVVSTRYLKRFFSNLFINGDVVVKARSVSAFTTAGNACVLALDPVADRGADFAGSSTVELIGCNVMSNSQKSESVYVGGSARLKSPCIMAAGGVSLSSNAVLTSCAAAMTYLPPVADPFKSVTEPTPPSGDCLSDGGATLSPGRYCGMNLKNTVTLNPGTYMIDGGTFKVNSNALVKGSGVTIYLYNGATMSLNGNATIQLSAPTSGAYKGMLFFGSRNTSPASDVVMNGTADSLMTGALYFPKQMVRYQGNFSGVNGCTQVVAKTIEWTGNTNLRVDCLSAGLAPISVGGVVKLAE